MWPSTYISAIHKFCPGTVRNEQKEWLDLKLYPSKLSRSWRTSWPVPSALRPSETPSCFNASISTARTASSDWWSQTGKDNSHYAAPPVDNPSFFPKSLVHLVSSQHSISTTSWRFKKLSRKSKNQKMADVTSAHNQNLLRNKLGVICAWKVHWDAQQLGRVLWPWGLLA